MTPRSSGPAVATRLAAWRNTLAARESERTIAVLLLTFVIVELAAVLIVSPTRFMSVDEAKYLGIGVNLFDGRGPLTVFDRFFPYHSPLWPALVVAPQAWFRIDALAWAHVLNVGSALAIVLLAGWFGWRVRPVVGAITGGLLLAFVYFISLGRTLGLDLPAAATCLAYVALGFTAVRRGSVRVALAAGAVFAVAFLIKEIALPFAPVPFLAGLVAGRSAGVIARLAACTLVVGVACSAWWFALYAGYTGTVYRLGTPGWTLGPLAIGTAALGVVGWFGPRILSGRFAPSRRATVAIGWAGTIAWLVLLSGFFAYTRVSIGQPFLTVDQVVKYGQDWLDQLGLVLAVGAVGAVLAVSERIRRARESSPPPAAQDDRWASAVDDLIVTTLCGLPLVLLVISVGELPRHYLAQAGVLLALGTAGWLILIERVLRRPDRTTVAIAAAGVIGAAACLLPLVSLKAAYALSLGALTSVVLAFVLIGPLRRRLARLAGLVPVGLALILTASSSAVFVAYSVHVSHALDDAKARAVTTNAAWVRANVPAGTRIAFAALFAYETADQLQGDYRSLQIRETQGVLFDPDAPLGVIVDGGKPADDWIALAASPNIAGVFYGYQASRLQHQLVAAGTSIWVVSTIGASSTIIPITQALEHQSGFRVLGHWSLPYQPGTLETYVLGVDPGQLRLASDRHVYVSQEALSSLIDLLARSGARGQAIARRLTERIVVVPDDATGRQLRSRLETLGGP